MIDAHNFRALALHLGFSADSQEVGDVLHKTYGENGVAIRIDFSKQTIEYPKAQGFKVNRADTCNFSSSENAVVLECVHRLLEKGYKPQHIELEPEWKLGHGGKSGRADILVRDQQGAALLIIECKTAGREFEKAWKDMGQIPVPVFTDAQQTALLAQVATANQTIAAAQATMAAAPAQKQAILQKYL